MSLDTRGEYEPSEALQNHEKLRNEFLTDASDILGEEYNAMEMQDIVSYFSAEDLKKWQSELSDLKARIDANRDNLSDKDIVVMKAKFIGRMIETPLVNEREK